jgi:hypothetical protein
MKGVLTVAATVLSLSGCALATLKPAQLGTVAVVSAADADTYQVGGLPIPGARAGAARGARIGALALLDPANKVALYGVGGGFAALVLAAVAPVSAGIGAVIGAVGAESEEDVASAESAIRDTLSQLDPARAVRAHLLEVMRMDPARIAMLDEAVAGGFDTILELYEINVSLAGPDHPEQQMNPDHELKMEIKTRLARPDGPLLHEETFAVTKAQSFVGWAAHDGRALRTATDRAARQLAETIVARYLREPVLVDPELARLPSKSGGW